MAKRKTVAEKNATAKKKFYKKAAAANNANIGNVDDAYRKMVGMANAGKSGKREIIVHRRGSGADRGTLYEDRPRAATITRKKSGDFSYLFPGDSEAIDAVGGVLERDEKGNLFDREHYASLADEDGKVAGVAPQQTKRLTKKDEGKKTGGGLITLDEDTDYSETERAALKAAGVDPGDRKIESNALLADMGEREAPQNVAQWLMNALSTGTYVGARSAEGAGAAVAKLQRGDSNLAEATGEGIVNAVGGAARGLAEGAGFRFDNQRPQTWGQNLENLGTKEFLQDKLGEEAGATAQGTLGFIADVGLDPLTYATVGGSGVLRGAAAGAVQGAREASTTAGKIASGAAGVVKGGAEGAAARRAELLAERELARETRKARREERRIGQDAYNDKYSAIDGELEDAGNPGALELEQPTLDADVVEPDLDLPALAASVEDEVAGTRNEYVPTPGQTQSPASVVPPALTAEDAKLIETGMFDENLLSPSARSATGAAVWDATEAVGKLFKDGMPVTGYTGPVYTTVHRAVMQRLSRALGKDLSGPARAKVMRDRYLTAMDAVESHQRSLGVIPRVTAEGGGGDLYVGAGDLIRALDPDVANRAFFSPMKGRRTFDADKAAEFKGGFTLFPDQVGAAVALALRGATADELAQFLIARQTAIWKGTRLKYNHRMPNWVASPEGKAAVEAVAENISRPDYLAAMRSLDARYRPVAEAVDLRVMNDVMDNAFTAIAKVIADEGADRGTLLAKIDEVIADAEKAFGPEAAGANKLNAEGMRRLNHALLNGVLGEKGFKAAQQAKGYSAATGRREPAAQATVQSEHIQKLRAEHGAGGGRTSTATKERPAPKPQNEQRHAAAEEGARIYAQEADEIFADIIDDMPPELVDEGFDFIAAEGLARLDNGSVWEFGSLMDKAMAGLSGRRGITDTALGARVAAEEGALTPMAAFSEIKQHTFARIRQDLQSRTQAKVSVQETNDYIRDRLWTALASTNSRNWGDVDALRAELLAGHDFPATKAADDFDQFDALTPEEVDSALALRALIDHVMNPGEGGKLSRGGLTVEDINAKLRHRVDENEKAFLLEGDDVHAQAGAWRVWQKLEDPLTMLDKVNQSLHLAQVPADLGRQFTALFSSRYDETVRNWTREQFRAAGWRKVDSDNAPVDSIMRHMIDKEVWYPPEALSQIRYLDAYLQAAKSPNPEKAFGKLVIAADAPLHVLKSLATIWRPAHHVTNVLGEIAMLTMAGVNPLQMVRSVRALRSAAGLLTDDIDLLNSSLRELGFGKGIAWDPKFESDVIRVRLRDGTGGTRFEEIPVAEAMKRWKSDGVALTHAAARDLIDDTVTRAGKRARALGRPIDTIEAPIGKFAAVRDNMTRVAHAIDAMEKGTFNSLEEAYAKTAGRVHDYHPTIRTTSAKEQLVARRVFMFYTWMRQAVSRVIRTALDRPGLVTWPSKLQYNMAEAAGLNPESIGGPTSDDPRLASYTVNSVIGPTLAGRPIAIDMLMKSMGWMPDEQTPGLAGQDAPQDLWEFSMSTPQLDTLQALFSGVTFDPEEGAQGYLQGAKGFTADTLGQSLNPLIPGVASLFGIGAQSAFGNETEREVEGVLQTGGALTAISKMFPDPSGQEANAFDAAVKGLSGTQRLKPLTPAEEEQGVEDRSKQVFNFFTGAKLQNRTTDKYAATAKSEWKERMKRLLVNRGITDSKVIENVLEKAWEIEQQNIRG